MSPVIPASRWTTPLNRDAHIDRMAEPSRARSDIGERAAEVGGWIYEGNLDRLVEKLAAYVDYRWDYLDDEAIAGVLDSTDADDPASWFEYPIEDDEPVTAEPCRVGDPYRLLRPADVGSDRGGHHPAHRFDQDGVFRGF